MRKSEKFSKNKIETLKMIRWKSGLNQQKFAEKMGFKHCVRISEFERGINPIPRSLWIVLSLLDRKIIKLEDIVCN